MSRNVALTIAASAAALGLAAAGCGSDDDGSAAPAATAPRPTSTTPATAAADLPERLRGTYERRVTRADIERTAKIRKESGGQHTPAPGPGRLTLGSSVMRLVDLAAEPPFQIEQSVGATAGTLSIRSYIRPERGSFCGPEIPQNATYAWVLEGDVLRLKARGDRCADRDSTLTGEWRRR